MKKMLMLLLVLTGCLAIYAQDNSSKKAPHLGIHFGAIDFQTAQDLRTNSFGTVIRQKNWRDVNRMNPAITVSYTQGVSKYVDFMGRLSGSFLAYPVRNTSNVASLTQLYGEADANANIKLLPDNYCVVPYLQVGVGTGIESSKLHAYVPFGMGLQFNLWDGGFAHLNTNYRIPATSRANFSLFHSLGISFPLGEKKAEIAPPPPPPPAPEPPKDRDGDGVLDVDDTCPDVAGVAALKGCPDGDNDGIADKDDKCPTESGVARYAGCPIPDSDKDGINDEEDKCPTVAGVARYAGCPIPDGDGDGVNDEEDKCPAVPGVATNAGCPEIKEEIKKKIEFAAKNVFFNTGSYQLMKKSYAPLNEVAKILKENPTLQLDVEGHTDNAGDAAKNQTLSENRSSAVKAYLIAQGIEGTRLTAAGYGPDRPVADNKTAAGKAKNRRVELKLRSY
jgi:OmpA-OmpF porin, OOP family